MPIIFPTDVSMVCTLPGEYSLAIFMLLLHCFVTILSQHFTAKLKYLKHLYEYGAANLLHNLPLDGK